jgi:hypothetical protein
MNADNGRTDTYLAEEATRVPGAAARTRGAAVQPVAE